MELLGEGFDVSVSTVARIISEAIKKGLIEACDHVISGSRTRRKRKSARTHAIRLPKGLRPRRTIEIIQINTVHVKLPDGRKLYHINAPSPVSRVCFGDAYTSASAKNAAVFVESLLDYMTICLLRLKLFRQTKVLNLGGGNNLPETRSDTLQSSQKVP